MERFEALYRQLFKNICEYSAKDRKNTTLATHFPVVGKHYTIPVRSMKQEEQKPRFMIVGRCSNGWDSQPHVAFEYNNEDLYIEEAMGYIANRATATKWREDAKQPKEDLGKPYNINRSAFWRTTQDIWAHLVHPGKPAEEDWYEQIVWTNLFPVAPKDKGNASNLLCDAQTDTAIKLFKETIRYFQPTHVLVESGMNWFSFTYKEQHHTFHDRIDKSLSNKSIAGRCAFPETKSRIVIANRPENINNAEYCDDVVHAFETMTISGEAI